MNIILRPGGGDRAKALPRPKVEVNSEGANVIVVKLTFPDNENIQGLRAFTPTDPGDLEKFAELRSALSSEDASVERISAISSEEENFVNTEDSEETETRLNEEKQKKKLEKLEKNEEQIVTNPTRPPRPSKAKRPSLSYLPPVGAPLPLSKPSLSYLPPIGAPVPADKSQKLFSFSPPRPNNDPKVINFMDGKKQDFFRFRDNSIELGQGSGEKKRIKPRQPQDEPPKYPLRPSSYERSSKELLPFRPSEAFNEKQHLMAAFPRGPSRPPRPPKGVKIINDSGAPPRPRGPPPRPSGLPHKGVQLTRHGQRHPGIKVQSRLDSVPSRSYYPILNNVWRGIL